MDSRWCVVTRLMVLSLPVLVITAEMVNIGTKSISTSGEQSYNDCHSNGKCDTLDGHCLSEIDGCNQTCTYGEPINVTVRVLPSVQCVGERNHSRTMICAFCYQLNETDYTCSTKTDCKSVGTYASRLYKATCTVNPGIICLGKRTFYKNKLCFWQNGYSWTTAMLLSITLGGFGVDRFYLGYWKEGLGKFFSFGGFGVWTIIDVVLLAVGYITPADGSLYTFAKNFSDNYYKTNLYSLT